MESRARRSARTLVVAAAFLVAGCSGTPTDPEEWVISPDAYGPITVDMTEAEILKAGPFVVARNACPAGRLDWHSQRYEPLGGFDQDGKPDLRKVAPQLATITLDGHGKPQFIDPNPQTPTDEGIREGDSLKQLKAVYGDRLITDGSEGGEENFAVNGKRSHLSFMGHKGKVVGFYLTPGKAADPYGAHVRGIAC